VSFKKFDADARGLITCAMRIADLTGVTPQDFLTAQALTPDDIPKPDDWRERSRTLAFTAETKKGMELSLRHALRAEHEFITREDVLAGMKKASNG